MGMGDVTRAAEAMGRLAAEMIQALDGVEAPPRGNPLSGVARSALTRCRQIAEQVSHLSGEAASQMRVFESSERRGRELAETRSAAKKRRGEAAGAKKRRGEAAGPTISKQAALPAAGDDWEEDPWDEL